MASTADVSLSISKSDIYEMPTKHPNNYNLDISSRNLKFFGHILRKESKRLVRRLKDCPDNIRLILSRGLLTLEDLGCKTYIAETILLAVCDCFLRN